MTAAQESLLRLRPKTDSDWLGSLREDAISTFEELGIPTRRLEEWKGTNFAPLAAMQFTRAGSGHATPEFAKQITTEATSTTPEIDEIVFIDGRLDENASRRSGLPEGLRALSLADVIANEPDLLDGKLGQLPDLKRQSLAALQTAYLEDGAVIVVEPGVQMTRPLRIRFVSTADGGSGISAAFPRLLVLAGEGSSATLLQEHLTAGDAPGLTAFVAEFFVGEGATIETVQMQAEHSERIHFSSMHAHLDRNARFDAHAFSLGEGLSRSEVEVRLAAPGAQTNLCGLFIGRDHGHTDHFTTVDHAASDCRSDEEYRGVLDDHSKGVFRGRVIVRPGAQKTDTRQSNPNLLLSDHSSIDTKPQLEIYADDIRASHGSTIGQLDADALFYLQTRGVGASDARLLLTRAFASSIVDRIGNDDLRQIATASVDATLLRLESGAPSRRETDAPLTNGASHEP